MQITKERRKKKWTKRNGLGKTNRASERSRIKTIHRAKAWLERKQKKKKESRAVEKRQENELEQDGMGHRVHKDICEGRDISNRVKRIQKRIENCPVGRYRFCIFRVSGLTKVLLKAQNSLPLQIILLPCRLFLVLVAVVFRMNCGVCMLLNEFRGSGTSSTSLWAERGRGRHGWPRQRRSWDPSGLMPNTRGNGQPRSPWPSEVLGGRWWATCASRATCPRSPSPRANPTWYRPEW